MFGGYCHVMTVSIRLSLLAVLVATPAFAEPTPVVELGVHTIVSHEASFTQTRAVVRKVDNPNTKTRRATVLVLERIALPQTKNGVDTAIALESRIDLDGWKSVPFSSVDKVVERDTLRFHASVFPKQTEPTKFACKIAMTAKSADALACTSIK
jgi:hypothetical protein